MEDLEYKLACKENTKMGDWIVVEGTSVVRITEVGKNTITAGVGTTIYQQVIDGSIVLRQDGTYTFGGGSIKKGNFLVIGAKGVSQIANTDNLKYDNAIILHQTGDYSVGRNLLRKNDWDRNSKYSFITNQNRIKKCKSSK